MEAETIPLTENKRLTLELSWAEDRSKKPTLKFEGLVWAETFIQV